MGNEPSIGEDRTSHLVREGGDVTEFIDTIKLESFRIAEGEKS